LFGNDSVTGGTYGVFLILWMRFAETIRMSDFRQSGYTNLQLVGHVNYINKNLCCNKNLIYNLNHTISFSF